MYLLKETIKPIFAYPELNRSAIIRRRFFTPSDDSHRMISALFAVRVRARVNTRLIAEEILVNLHGRCNKSPIIHKSSPISNQQASYTEKNYYHRHCTLNRARCDDLLHDVGLVAESVRRPDLVELVPQTVRVPPPAACVGQLAPARDLALVALRDPWVALVVSQPVSRTTIVIETFHKHQRPLQSRVLTRICACRARLCRGVRRRSPSVPCCCRTADAERSAARSPGPCS